MTSISNSFVKYQVCINKQHDQKVDGTLLLVADIGSINLASIGLLTRVLHVPKFFMSLLSVHRIGKLDEYKIMFDDCDNFFV